MVVPREHVGSSAIARQRSDPIARQRARLGHESNRVHARSSVDTRNRCRGTRIATSASGPGRSFLGCYGGRTRPNSRDCRPSPVRSGNHRHFGKPLSASNEFRFLVAIHNWPAHAYLISTSPESESARYERVSDASNQDDSVVSMQLSYFLWFVPSYPWSYACCKPFMSILFI